MALIPEQPNFDWNQYGTGNEPMPTAQPSPISPSPVAPTVPPPMAPPPIASASPGPVSSVTVPIAPQPVGSPSPEIRPNLDASPLSPRQLAAANIAGYQQLSSLAKQEGEARAAGQTQTANLLLQTADQQRQSLLQSDANYQAAHQKVDDDYAKIKQEVQRGMAMKLDPNNYWNKAGTGSNILSAISVGLGAFASGMTHGATGNPGLQLLNAAIDHDMASQKENIENYWKGIQQKTGMADTAFNRAITTQTIEGNQRLAYLSVADMQLKGIEAGTTSAVTKLGAQKMQAEIGMQINKERGNLASVLAQQQAAAAAAQQAHNDKLDKNAEKRGEQTIAFTQTLISQGYSPEEASKMASKQVDVLHPELAGSIHASPGQKYQSGLESTTNNFLKLNLALNDKNDKKADQSYGTTYKTLTDAGMSPQQAHDYINQIKNSSHKDLIQLGKDTYHATGVVDPNATIDSTSPSLGPFEVPDPQNPSNVYKFKSKEDAAAYKKTAIGLNRLVQVVEQWKDIRKKHGGGFNSTLNPDDAQQAEMIKQEVLAKVNESAGGILKPDDIERLSKGLPDPSRYDILGNTDTQLDNVINFAKSSNENYRNSLGVQTIQRSENKKPQSPVTLNGSTASSALAPAAISAPVVPSQPSIDGTYFDDRPGSPTQGKTLNIVTDEMGRSWLRDPQTGNRYLGLAPSAASLSAEDKQRKDLANDRYGASKRE